MNQSVVTSRRPRSRRRPALIAAAVAAVGAGIMVPAVANGATVTYPANQTFDTNGAGWTGSGSCTILDGLLKVSGSSDPAAIETSGLLQDLVNGLLGGGADQHVLGTVLNNLLTGVPLTNDAVTLLTQTIQGLTGVDVNGLVNNGVLNIDALIAKLLETADGAVDTVTGLLAQLGILCTVQTPFTATEGNPPGGLKVQVNGLLPNAANVLELLGKAKATFTSDPFTAAGTAPASLKFEFDAKTQLGALLEIGQGFVVKAALNSANGGSTALGEWTLTAADANWQTLTGNVPASALTPGGSYSIVLTIETTGTLNLLNSTHNLLLDNIRLVADDGTGNTNTGNTNNNGVGAGGLGTCTTNIVTPAPPRPGSPPGQVRLTREQLVINQRISSAGVKRVNTVLDKLQAGLTGADFQNCVIGPDKFAPSLLQAISAGAPAGAATAVAAPRATANRTPKADNSAGITLSRLQLITNQRISAAAVRRVNAIQKRLAAGLTAGDIRNGTLDAVTLNSRGRFAFANALPAAGQVSSVFVPLEIKRKKPENVKGVKLSRAQLVINQRISSAAVRRINAVQAQLRVGLTDQNVKPGGLSRSTLTPAIQLGQR